MNKRFANMTVDVTVTFSANGISCVFQIEGTFEFSTLTDRNPTAYKKKCVTNN